MVHVCDQNHFHAKENRSGIEVRELFVGFSPAYQVLWDLQAAIAFQPSKSTPLIKSDVLHGLSFCLFFGFHLHYVKNYVYLNVYFSSILVPGMRIIPGIFRVSFNTPAAVLPGFAEDDCCEEKTHWFIHEKSGESTGKITRQVSLNMLRLWGRVKAYNWYGAFLDWE